MPSAAREHHLQAVELAERGAVPQSRLREELARPDNYLPAGQTQTFELGRVVEFDAEICDLCPLRDKCTAAQEGNGRTVSIPENEVLQQRLCKLQTSPAGRTKLRKRTGIEHHLAHLSQRQGHRARYRGVRKNMFDIRRAAAIQNLETIHRGEQAQTDLRKAA